MAEPYPLIDAVDYFSTAYGQGQPATPHTHDPLRNLSSSPSPARLILHSTYPSPAGMRTCAYVH